MENIGPLIDALLRRFGVAKVKAMADLAETWQEQAPEPWASQARPLVIQGTTLVVEVSQGARSVLKYAERDLLEHLADGLGEGTVPRLERRTGPAPKESQRVRHVSVLRH
jgi:hypothetical protein